MRTQLRKEVFGDFPTTPRPAGKLGKPKTADGIQTVSLLLEPEPGVPLPAVLKFKRGQRGRVPVCVLLHLDGGAEALKHPLAGALLDKGWEVIAPDLRATGATKPARDDVRDAPDHNSAEHALWVGRPLLGQWVFDVQCLLDWMALQPGLNRRRFAVAGIGQAGVVALCAGGLLDDHVASVAAVDTLVSYVTDRPYAAGTRMGLLAPGILRVGDVPHLAALTAPRKLQIVGGTSPLGKKLAGKELAEAFAFTSGIYKLHKAGTRLAIEAQGLFEEVVDRL